MTDKLTFHVGLTKAIKVRFRREIFEDDFPEAGMKAWLTKIEYYKSVGCYKLHFDFTEFEDRNEKYLTADYYDENHIPRLTAREVGLYSNKYSAYFGDDYDPETLNEELAKYLEVIDVDRS